MSSAKPEPRVLPKRFYAAAIVQQNEGDFCITLDGKAVKTPMGKLLQTPSRELAQSICDEWNAQQDVIDTDSMPLTRLLNITLDRVPLDRAALLEGVVAYAETDLICYRENEHDTSDAGRELALLQHKHFTPILDWCSKTYGIRFAVTEGVMPAPQPIETVQAIRLLFDRATDHELAALAMMVPLLGSVLLALAVWKQAIGIEEALTAARLDERIQAKYWGEDPEMNAKWADKRCDARAAAFFLTCN